MKVQLGDWKRGENGISGEETVEVKVLRHNKTQASLSYCEGGCRRRWLAEGAAEVWAEASQVRGVRNLCAK